MTRKSNTNEDYRVKRGIRDRFDSEKVHLLTRDEAEFSRDLHDGVMVLVGRGPHQCHIAVHEGLAVPPRGSEVNHVDRLARMIVQEIRIVGVGLDKPPFEEFPNRDNQHGARDGVAHLLRQTHGLIDGEAGHQLGSEDARGAQLGVHLGHVAVLV